MNVKIACNEDITIFVNCFIKGVGSFIKKCELTTFNFYFLFEIVSAKEIVSEILVSKSFNLFTIRQSLT